MVIAVRARALVHHLHPLVQPLSTVWEIRVLVPLAMKCVSHKQLVKSVNRMEPGYWVLRVIVMFVRQLAWPATAMLARQLLMLVGRHNPMVLFNAMVLVHPRFPLIRLSMDKLALD